MKIATWNVNGIRARQAQVQEFLEKEQPDVLCLQEIKASPDQLPLWLVDLESYWSYWHGDKGYSGVALLVRKATCPERPRYSHPAFDFERRIAAVHLSGLTVVSVYVPNGGKDFDAKIRFLEALDAYAAEAAASGTPIAICGDMNVTRTEMDVHPKERKPGATGQRPDERALLERLISRGLVDVHRQKEPDNPNLFTWWAPWRQMRERNIGWRLDYVFASASLASRLVTCEVQRETGTSDHGPVIAVFT